MEAALQAVPKPPQPKLVSKLVSAISEIDLVPKRGRNDFNSYNYATAEDIVNAVRPVLIKHGLLVYATLKERAGDSITTSQGKSAFRERIVLTVVVTDGESSISVDIPGEGQDAGDKATYKAITGATKYALRSLLQLPIGDDPETDESQRPQGAKQSSKPPLSVVQPPLSHGTHQTQATGLTDTMATPRQLNAIHVIAKACQIDDEHLKQGLQDGWKVDSAEALTRKQASELLDILKTEQLRRRPAPAQAQ